jgi:hypothetical protein
VTEETLKDRERQHLVPVARLNLPDQPDLIHLSVYQWMPALQAWATGMAICGYSTQQGPLLKATVTCPECLAYQPRYERMLAPGYRPEDDDPDVLRERLAQAERDREQLRTRLQAVTDETVARVVGPNIELLCEEINRLKAERDVLRRSLARLAHVVASVAMFAFGRDDSRRALLRVKWLTADRVLAYTSGPADGCDCDRTALRRSWHAGHLVTCPNHVGRHGRTLHYGKKADR